MIVCRVVATAVPNLDTACGLAGVAWSFVRGQGRGVAGPAPRGRPVTQDNPQAAAGLGGPGCVVRVHPAAAQDAAHLDDLLEQRGVIELAPARRHTADSPVVVTTSGSGRPRWRNTRSQPAEPRGRLLAQHGAPGELRRRGERAAPARVAQVLSARGQIWRGRRLARDVPDEAGRRRDDLCEYAAVRAGRGDQEGPGQSAHVQRAAASAPGGQGRGNRGFISYRRGDHGRRHGEAYPVSRYHW